MNYNLDILRKLITEDEEEIMKNPPKTFEDDPMNFILNKYQSLKENLVYLMGDNFQEYLTAIYIIAPKPTMFKIVLHNGQYFFMTYMGDNYQVTISGKNYLLFTAGEKQRAMLALTRLLRWGSPLKTKGAEGAEETGTEETTGGAEEAPPAESSDTSSEEAGGETETLEESKKVLKQLIEGKEKASLFENNKKVLNEETEDKRSTLFETALIIAWYTLNKKKIPQSAVDIKNVNTIKENHIDLITFAKQCLEAHPSLLKPGKTYHAGKSGTATLTPDWTKYGASNATSKTDVVLGGYKISVKVGKSQLMSGEKEESKATFYAALKSTPELVNSSEIKKIIKDIDAFAKGGLTKGKIQKAKQAGKDKALLAADKLNKNATKDLQHFFQKNEQFAIAFAKEAMTGEVKFGHKSPACAKWILATDANFTNSVFHQTSNQSYLKKVADQMTISVSFKTGSVKNKELTGWYRFSTALRLQLDPSSTLEEGFFDDVKNKLSQFLNKFTSSIKSLVDFFIGNSENAEVDVSGEDNIDFS